MGKIKHKNNYMTIYGILCDFTWFFEGLFSGPYPGIKKNLLHSKKMLEFHRQFCLFHEDKDDKGFWHYHYVAVINYVKWIFDNVFEINDMVNEFIDAQNMSKKQKQEWKEKFYIMITKDIYGHLKDEWETDEEIISEFSHSCCSASSFEDLAWRAELRRLDKNCRLMAKTSNATAILKAKQIQWLVHKQQDRSYLGSIPLKNMMELNEWLEGMLTLHELSKEGIVTITKREDTHEENCIEGDR